MQHLEHILECIHDKHIFIQTHNFPDPDAIASAYGLKVLLEKKGIGATICYKGRIDDTITAKMAQLLAIDIVEQEEITDMSAESEIILVDSQKGNANVIDMQGNEVLCIDHHRPMKIRIIIIRISVWRLVRVHLLSPATLWKVGYRLINARLRHCYTE